MLAAAWLCCVMAEELRDLAAPPGNRLEALLGSRAGPHSIRINDQWRLVSRLER
jgi:plasmid maintenance system killer protein